MGWAGVEGPGGAQGGQQRRSWKETEGPSGRQHEQCWLWPRQNVGRQEREKGVRAPEQGALLCPQDLWLFPNILTFHPEAARALLEYRIRTLGGALDNARKLGYQVRGTHIPPRPVPIASGSSLGGAGIPGFLQGFSSIPQPALYR